MRWARRAAPMIAVVPVAMNVPVSMILRGRIRPNRSVISRANCDIVFTDIRPLPWSTSPAILYGMRGPLAGESLVRLLFRDRRSEVPIGAVLQFKAAVIQAVDRAR